MQQALGRVNAPAAIVHESYDGGFTATTPHALYSGTKSFWGIAALEARSRWTRSTLDEHGPAAAITRAHAARPDRRIRLRRLGSAVPTYERALEIPLKNAPGSERSPTAASRCKSSARSSPSVCSRETHAARVSARTRARARRRHRGIVAHAQGRHASVADRCISSRARLARVRHVRARAPRALRRGIRRVGPANRATDLAGGSAAQRCRRISSTQADPAAKALYVIPSLELVAVRFSDSGSPNHPATVKNLLSLTSP